MWLNLLSNSLINKKVISNIPRHHCWRHGGTVDCCVVPLGGAFSKPRPAKWRFEMHHQAGLVHFLLGREVYVLHTPSCKYRLDAETHYTQRR
jgi:hypothetical protein